MLQTRTLISKVITHVQINLLSCLLHFLFGDKISVDSRSHPSLSSAVHRHAPSVASGAGSGGRLLPSMKLVCHGFFYTLMWVKIIFLVDLDDVAKSPSEFNTVA